MVNTKNTTKKSVPEDPILDASSEEEPKKSMGVPSGIADIVDSEDVLRQNQSIPRHIKDFVMSREFDNPNDNLYRKFKWQMPVGGRVFVPDAVNKKIEKDMERHFGKGEKKEGHVIYKT